jgi:probable phosphoglycerate mutase
MTVIYLVRHGTTDALGKRLCGHLPGFHLNDFGKAQATRAARFLENVAVSAVYSSPLERTMETASIVAQKFGLDVLKADFLKEMNFGILQGMEKAELLADPIWQQFNTAPAEVRFPQGETAAEAQNRVVQGLNLLSQRHKEEEIVCVSHCEILRLAVAHALDIPLDSILKITIDPASVSKIDWQIDRQQLISLNIIPE